MSADTHTYDLVLLLDPRAEDQARQRVLADTKAAIEKHGELVRHDEWGLRPLAYQIQRHPEAEYHLLQMKPTDVALIGELDRALRISDEVLRFMISKVKPGTPPPPVKPEARRSSEPEQTAA